MTQIRAVSEKAPDPKAGIQKRISGVAFPYYNLEQSIDVARVIHERAGGSCDRPQLAAFLGYKGTSNGSFVARVTAAKMYGVIDQEGNQLRVTPRGKAIVAPIVEADAKRAKLEAFMQVPLFKAVYDEFAGNPLPPDVGLRNLLATKYSVVRDRVAPTVKIMRDSAEAAGLFSTNKDRMVMPILGAQTVTPKAPANPPPDEHRRTGGNGSGGDGGGNDTSGIHPAILGLLKELPPVGTILTSKKRMALIAAFTATVGFIYPDPDDAG